MKKIKALLLVCVLCVCVTPWASVIARADALIDWYDQWSADYTIEVTDPDGYVNIRSGPGTEYDIVTTAPTGAVLQVYSEAYASDGATWCQVEYNGCTGWLALSRAEIVDPAADTAEEEGPAETAAPDPTDTPAPTAAPTDTPAPAETTAPAAAPAADTENAEATASAVTVTVPEQESNNSGTVSILLLIFIPLVLIVIALAVVLIILLRRTR